MSIVGTRPDLIKMSEIIKKLDKHTQHVLVHTGQNYDKQLADVFYDDLNLRRPDYHLGVATDQLGKTIGKILEETEKALRAEEPEAVVILGDTNSALAGYMAKRLKIPFFHLEAGNRSFDDNVPEEINRRILDHIADVNLVYTENARRYLLSEGIAKDRIFLMGSPMHEVLKAHMVRITKNRILKELNLKPKQYYLVSTHRDENIEIPQNFVNLIHGVNILAETTKSTIVMPLHPRTFAKLAETKIGLHRRIITHEPFGFLDYCKLQTSAACVISDSGTIAEESALLNFPAVTIRNAIERPEAIDAGSIILAQPNGTSLMTAVSVARAPDSIPDDYLVENCSERVLRVVLGYTGYVNRYVWHV